jgi:hypothetical protein
LSDDSAVVGNVPARRRVTALRQPAHDAAAVAVGVASAIILAWVVGRDYPLVGHDFRYYIPRLLDTDLHLRLNGLVVQWYTPTFGGGLPAFPNPQHLQHSLLQLLTYVVDPWSAVQATSVGVSVAGFYAFYRLLCSRLTLERLPSLFGAACFIGNGFYIEHMIVGHVGFQLFPLVAVLLLAITDTSRRVLFNVALVASIVTAMFFHAGVYLIVILSLTGLITLPLLWLIDRRAMRVERVVITMAMAVPLMLAMSGSKLYAGLALMRQFPREVADVPTVGLMTAIVGVFAQLVGAMPVAPVLALLGLDQQLIWTALSRLTGASDQIGMWELDTGLSPALLLVLAVAVVVSVSRFRLDALPRLDRGTAIALLILVATTWVVLEAGLTRGLLYPHLKALPILRSLHVNPRIVAVFIVPLTIVGAVLLHRWYCVTQRTAAVSAVIGLAVAAPLMFMLIPARVHFRTFDVSESIEVSHRIRAGELLPVQRIADSSDAQALSEGASSFRPYEPMFGYDLRTFAATTRIDDVREVSDGRYNLTNPVGLVFPAFSGVRPFERIRVEQQEQMEAFVARRQPGWPLPPIVQPLNVLAIASTVATLAALCVFARRSAGIE